MIQYFEIMVGSMIMNSVNNIKTGYFILDAIIILSIIVAFMISKDNKMSGKIKDSINEFIFPSSHENKISFMFKKGEQSNRCKALFHYLSNSTNINNDIKHLVEDVFKKYDRYKDDEKEHSNIYRVDQSESFSFTKQIKGRVFTEEKETTEFGGKVVYKEFVSLEVFSETANLKTIQEFIEKCRIDYNKSLKESMLDHQYIITIENSVSKEQKEDELKILQEEWSSNVTFDTRFFPQKQEIISTIDNFLNKKEWYKEKGLNHTLGILLSGKAGCGKTSFIKALLNYTQRHAVEVKLNDNFDFSELKDIVFDEEIDDDIIIPQDKRIIIFEDIDAMGNIVKDRDLKEKENDDAQERFQEEVMKYFSTNDTPKSSNKSSKKDFVEIKNKINSKENNNLSYFLNILDGINETPGRIIIMTTNKPEILDKALIRPGRIDIKIKFEESTVENLKEIIYHFWKTNDSEYNKVLHDKIESTDFSRIDKKLTPAEIVDISRKSNSIDKTIELLFNFTIEETLEKISETESDSY